jgi:hypothetical protein
VNGAMKSRSPSSALHLRKMAALAPLSATACAAGYRDREVYSHLTGPEPRPNLSEP